MKDITKNKPLLYCKDEFIDYLVYKELSKREKNEERRKLLEKLSEQEYKHYKFWKKYAPEYKEQTAWYIILMILMRKIFGLTFTLKFLERHEEKVIDEYKKFAEELPANDKNEFEEIINDEISHEKAFMGQINEGVVKYMSFIVLGLADAIVEISGVHAGFLGVTDSTLIAGIAGLVVGFAAAISMAAAAYLQAKHDIEKSAIISAIATGLAYIGAVSLLASPYFVTHNMIIAFTVSTLLAILLTAGFTYYGAVVFERKFAREFIESVILIMATAFGAFLFGGLLGNIFGIRGFFQ
ncbi:MAG: VIT1/CCC1 family protein [Thermoprotei archaeon]